MRAARPIRSASLLLAALASVGCAVAQAGQGPITVYKWIDAHGVIHYSDQPHPNARKLQVSGAQTYAAASAPLPASSGPAAQQAAGRPAGYGSCVITQPQEQQMLMNAYRATAVVQTEPPLRAGDRIRLFYDGRRLPGTGPSFTFPVHRGQHTVSAVVVDSLGQIVCETSTVTFYVHQPSVLNPHGPLYHPPPRR